MTANRDLGKLVPLPTVAGQFIWNQATNSWQQVTKAMVGLGSVDNTADSAKPVSGPQQTALDFKANIDRPTLLGPVTINPFDAASVSATLSVNRDLTNSVAINIPQALSLQFTDKSAASRLSAQVFRFTYTRDAAATGSPSSFDAMSVFTPVINVNTPFSVRGFVMEGPAVASGVTLQSWIAMRLQAPSGAGATTNKIALMVDPAGNVLVGSTSDNGKDILQAYGPFSATGPVKIGAYTLTTLPSASLYSGYLIDVTNATGGPKTCRSNGTVWQILNTTTTVS